MPKKKRRNKKKRNSFKNNNYDNDINNDSKELEKNEIKEEISINDDDEIKITNIDYEKFLQKNEILLNFISNSNPLLIVHNEQFNEEINIKNITLLNIIKKSGLTHEIKSYITLQIISENIEFETLSRKSFSFNPKFVNYIKQKDKYNIKVNNKDISINRKNLDKIFNLMSIYHFEEIINYIEFIITEIIYKYEKSQKLYMLKNDKNNQNILSKNKIFYIKNNHNENNILLPLTNYSLNKIFDLINDTKDNKYLLVYYKIKEEEENNINNNEESIYLNKLINASDLKNIYLKYKSEKENNTLKIFSNNNNLDRINILNITDLNHYINSSSDLLSNISNQISSKKSQILNLSENIINQFIKIIIPENKVIFLKKRIFKELEQKKSENKMNNIYNINTYDYKKENHTIEVKYMENYDEDDIYVEIEIDNNKYLCNKNNMLKIYDSWKILNQKEIIDALDIKDFTERKINIELLKLNIINQDDYINIDFNIQNKINNKDKNKMTLNEYVKTLPKKKVFNIKYKVKVQRIPKNNNNN